MVRRSLGAALWSLVGLFACFLGGLSALVGTGAGRGLLGRIASRVVAGAIDGRITVGSASRALLTRMTLTDVNVYPPHSGVFAVLPRVELAYNPFYFAAARGSRADVQALAVAIWAPRVRITDLDGRITVVGDSLDADVSRLRLPASAVSVRGHVRWPHGGILYALDVRVDSATLGDVGFLDRRFAKAAVLRGRVGVRSHGGRVLEVQVDPLGLRDGSGRLTGRATALTAADSGLVGLRQTDLTAEDFSLEFARSFLDTLPFAGRLSRRTVPDASLAALQLPIDWTFLDSLLAGW